MGRISCARARFISDLGQILRLALGLVGPLGDAALAPA
eukprot:CAMPEP_0204462686 /NCGR_PEP_ID=MMETSP0471-20130131/6345_1 /ASSEMBLY_ACC=CAM_ASM_000602 /TAXON_ID=2969 /ORGANISM="Oxyrrhis marina" /LENGTH=37 /DNA_ID= /DNA_START= /DNA_END= /DNA_ORIENTATION=